MTGPVWEPEAPPGLEQFLSWNVQPIPVLPTIAALLALIYLGGAVRLWSQSRRWSIVRTLCFLAGCGLLFMLTALGVEGYGLRMFSVFVFQQLTLTMVIPPLLVLGSPGTLLLRATPHHGPGRLVVKAALGALRSRVARGVLHPALITPFVVLTLFGLYFTGAANIILRSWPGHVLLELAFLTIGIVLATPLISADPLPRRTSFVARIFDAIIEMQLHAAFGLIVMFSTTPLVPFFAALPKQWGIDPLKDQGLAGALVWTYGELPVVILLIVTLIRWQGQEGRKATKASKEADATGDPDLEEYNNYLRSLQKEP